MIDFPIAAIFLLSFFAVIGVDHIIKSRSERKYMEEKRIQNIERGIEDLKRGFETIERKIK